MHAICESVVGHTFRISALKSSPPILYFKLPTFSGGQANFCLFRRTLNRQFIRNNVSVHLTISGIEL